MALSIKYRLRVVDACLLLLVVGTICYGSLASMKPMLPGEVAYLAADRGPHGLRHEAVRRAFSSGYFGQWQPLAWLSHELDYELYGSNLRAHRVTSLVLHLLNTMLLFVLFAAATGQKWRSLLAAGVFALHPLHLEAVTAPAGRGIVLGTLFVFLALFVYGSAANKPRIWHYSMLLLLFIAAVLASPAVIVFPFLLLLCDLWPLARLKFRGVSAERSSARGWVAVKGMKLRGLLTEKLPMLLVAATLALFSILAAQQWYSNPLLAAPGWLRAALDTFGWLFLYLGRALWPFTISAFFAAPAAVLPFWQGAAALLVLCAVSITIAVKMWKYPALFAGWFWFLISLFPHLPLVRWGAPAGSDSAIYLPLTGLIAAAIWGLPEMARRQQN